MAHDTFILNSKEDDEIACCSYQKSNFRTFLYVVCCLLSIGTLWLVVRWKPNWKAKFLYKQCPVFQAHFILIKDLSGNHHVVPVKSHKVHDRGLSSSEYITSVDCDEDTSMLESASGSMKFFEFHYVRYIWDYSSMSFQRLRGLESGRTCIEFKESLTGLSSPETEHKLLLYGSNLIDVQVKSYGKLLFDEVLNPFYIFQIMSVALWFSDNYYYYAACIVVISAVSLIVALRETRKQSETLAAMVASHSEGKISVCRPGEVFEEVDVKQLVPGDRVVIPRNGCIMSCDAVLVAGNCIVNESMLTGESVPVTKTALSGSEDDEEYNPDVHKRHTLFSGTHVIQTRYYGNAKVMAVVVRTGFNTAKGELVRSILFPKSVMFKFYQDAMKFIGVLAILASVGMAYSTTIYVLHGEPIRRIVIRALDIITIVVPPALPAAMTVGTIYAQSRLKKQHIFCISPPKINVCGKLNLICFDKTGTLTEDGLDMWGVVQVGSTGSFLLPDQCVEQLPRGPLQEAMAACHSLTRIDGNLTGDPLDLKMFEATGWSIEEPGEDSTCNFDNLCPTIVSPPAYSIPDEPTWLPQAQYEVGIIRQFPFASSLQRMTVITRVLGVDHMDLYCKGAPEKVTSLCAPDTIPNDFQAVLSKFTMKGFRVIAVAHKALDPKLSWHHAQKITRDKLEQDLRFVGLVILQNSLKQETTPVIHQLKSAKIRTVMVTGDNMHTAISVARDCGMIESRDRVVICNAHPPQSEADAMVEWELADTGNVEDTDAATDDSDTIFTAEDTSLIYQIRDEPVSDIKQTHLAVSGKSFAVLLTHFPSLVPMVCSLGTVFARMSPDQKTELVENLQELGYFVGMCGDGANDCGALKTAHAGVSLSEAEASVASPFTSKQQNIQCIPTVIREGRAALVTSFGTFKYMALYSLIQCVSVLILYTKYTNLGDFQFLYIDLVIVTLLAIVMGYTEAYPKLVAQKPSSNLISTTNICSIFAQVLIQALFQAGIIFYLILQTWYVPLPTDHQLKETIWSHETTIVFGLSSFQYISVCIVFSVGPPFRKPLYTNLALLLSTLILMACNIWLVLGTPAPVAKFFQLQPLPSWKANVVVLGLAACNFFASWIAELLIVDYKLLKRCLRKCCSVCGLMKKKPKRYAQIRTQLRQDNWPPVGCQQAANNCNGTYDNPNIRIGNVQANNSNDNVINDIK